MSKDKRLCERRNKILEALSSRHTLLVSDLVVELQVSNCLLYTSENGFALHISADLSDKAGGHAK